VIHWLELSNYQAASPKRPPQQRDSGEYYHKISKIRTGFNALEGAIGYTDDPQPVNGYSTFKGVFTTMNDGAKKHVDWALEARWLATVDSNDHIFENSTLLVNGDRIVDLLATDQARERYTAVQTVSLPNHLLIPGLINAHGHAAMSLLRGFADDLPLMTWLQEHIWPAETAHVSPEFVADGTLLAIAEMIRTGTTCFADMYFFPEETARVASETGMRAYLAPPVFDFPSNWQADADQYLAAIEALAATNNRNPLLSLNIGPHAPYTVSDDNFEKIRLSRQNLGCQLHIHCHESAQEIEDSRAQYGMRPLARLAKLGVLGPYTQCVHMTQIAPEDIALLKQHLASVIHCPKSNLKLASGFCPVQSLLDESVNVALGTDGGASNNNLDMISEMQFAALIGKAVSNDAEAVDAQEVLRMATINGAIAFGLDAHIGSLEIGKQADITAVELSNIGQGPIYSPLSALVYSSHGYQVSDVWIAGKQKLKAGELLDIDVAELKAKQLYWQQKINAAKPN